MSEMSDRVRDAIRNCSLFSMLIEDSGWVRSNVPNDAAEEFARAAIEAMREPTTGMLDAGPPEPYMDPEVWAKMIDAALNKSPPPQQ